MKKTLSLLLILALVLSISSALAFDSCPALKYVGNVDDLPWAEFLTDGDVVGEPHPQAMVNYSGGKKIYVAPPFAPTSPDCLPFYEPYLKLFDDYVYENPDTVVGNLDYYMFDPTEHGFDPEGTYPVSIWLHGYGNQMMGKQAVMAAGAATFGCDKFQQTIGGMYIIVPIANQETCWTPETAATIKGIYDEAAAGRKFSDELFMCGTSAGGMMVNDWLTQYADITDGVFWMSTTLPDPETVKQYSDMGIMMWYEVGRHDRAYDNSFPNGAEVYDGIENFEYTVLEWIRWGNGMIATLGKDDSINGQHCSCIQVLRNLVLDDGTPDDPAHPDGVTGWFRDTLAKIRVK